MKSPRKVVIKIGSALITNDGEGLDHTAIHQWSEQIAKLRKSGIELVLVSSGAVAEGVSRLGMSKRPDSIHELQATAAVGQMGLVQAYEVCFQHHGLHSAQVLLTHDDLANRKRYLNARTTLRTLLQYGTVPVVNENDAVANDEFRFGDNDTLGALVANLIEADLLIILTDQKGLFDADPRKNSNAKLITNADATDPSLLKVASTKGGLLGSGGMYTKVLAAQRAAKSGTDTIIASGKIDNVICRLVEGEKLGSLLKAGKGHMQARKQWLSGHMHCAGTLQLDPGAVRVLQQSGASLLPVGVKNLSGDFKRGECVACLDNSGNQIARGLVNYSAQEAAKIIGQPSHQIAEILEYKGDAELIHRDNIVVL